MTHTPVLLNEVLKFLKVESGKKFIDATADGGGHAIAIIKAIQPRGKLLAIEWDEELYEKLEERLKQACTPFSKNYVLKRASYATLGAIAHSLKFAPVAGVLFDLGFSSFHPEASRRGFSFRLSEPLNMRYSSEVSESAADILNQRTEPDLVGILKNFGEERFAEPIARAIVRERRIRPFRTTEDLVHVVRRAVPPWYCRRRIHFATRTFQALRMAVNHELENIERGLAGAAEILAPGGRIVTISFHSIEDRTVKRFFQSESVKKSFRAITKKPVRPSREELYLNPRARSSRLRAFQRLP